MEVNQGFTRRIRERTPVSLEHDRVVLECGHTRECNALSLDLRSLTKLDLDARCSPGGTMKLDLPFISQSS
jgi:hypothetical protein